MAQQPEGQTITKQQKNKKKNKTSKTKKPQTSLNTARKRSLLLNCLLKTNYGGKDIIIPSKGNNLKFAEYLTLKTNPVSLGQISNQSKQHSINTGTHHFVIKLKQSRVFPT